MGSLHTVTHVLYILYMLFDQVPLFQNTEIGFTKLLALHIKPVLYLSKEYIVRKGDIGSEVSHDRYTYTILYYDVFVCTYIVIYSVYCICY